MASIYDLLGTLQSPVRVRLLRVLALEELQVGEVASVLQLPQSTASRHLKALLDDGWLDRRRDGAAAWFALARDLPEDARRLWELVSEATDDEHPEDGLRLASVLAARQVDSRAFFGRVAGGWTEARRALYGDSFQVAALLSLLPPDWTVADLGCGPGDLLAAIAPWVGRVIGIDREPAMLQAAARRTDTLSTVELRQGALEQPPLAEGEVDAALLVLVLHLVDDPAAVVAAAAPALRPGGSLVIVDMVAHERDEYRRTMGHQHLGFDEDQVAGLARVAGLTVRRRQVLPPAPEATGPALFVAVLGR